MTGKERLARIREVERTAERLVKKGWRMECIEHVDEPGEPFRSTIRVACDGSRIGDDPL